MVCRIESPPFQGKRKLATRRERVNRQIRHRRLGCRRTRTPGSEGRAALSSARRARAAANASGKLLAKRTTTRGALGQRCPTVLLRRRPSKQNAARIELERFPPILRHPIGRERETEFFRLVG